jgi:hypothetical protein
LHENRTLHGSINKAAFGKTRDCRIKSPPSYSFDVSPPNILFPENKSMLKGRKFEETKIVTNKLLA